MPNELAYGFVSLQNLFGERLTNVNANVVDTAVVQSLAEHNRQVNALLALVAERTTLTQERFQIPGSGTLQPLDDNGIPLPIRVSGYADLGFPIRGGGTAWGTNRVSRVMMTVGEANRYQLTVQQQDADWIRRHVLSRLLDKNSWSFTDPDVGALTIQPLANGDAVQYLVNGQLATDNHYIAQAAGIADATNPFPVIWTELTEHPGNAGPIVAYVASNLRADIENLATFVPVSDPDIAVGSGSDRVTGVPEGIRAFGDEVIGKVDGVWVVVWSFLPSNYIVAFAQGSPDAALAMREYPDASLQGLFEETHSPDGNRFERRFIRYAGFGARNRTAALAYFVAAGDTTYDVPTGYANPLAV